MMLFRGSDVSLSIIRIGRGHILNEGSVWVPITLKSQNRQQPLSLKTNELPRSDLDGGIFDCLSA